MQIETLSAAQVDTSYERRDATVIRVTVEVEEAASNTRLKSAHDTYAVESDSLGAGIFETLSQFISVEVYADDDMDEHDEDSQVIDVNVQELPASVVESLTLYDVAYIAMSHSRFKAPTRAEFFIDLDDALTAMVHQPGA